MRTNRRAASVVVALLLVGAVPGAASAEIRASGSEDNIALRADNASLPEVLSGLQSALHVKIMLIGTTPRQFTGSYSGPLRRVLARLLDGVSYIVTRDPDGMRIAIVGAGARGAAAQLSLPPGGSTIPAIEVADQQRDASGVQGWIPTEDPLASFKAKSAAGDRAQPFSIVADAAENTSGVQGWIPTEDPFAAYSAKAQTKAAANAANGQAQPAAPQADGAENNGGAQGWIPTADPFAAYKVKTPAATAANVTGDQAQPAAGDGDDPGNNSGVQGWIPTEDPFKAYKDKAPATQPRTENNQAPPDADKFAAMMAGLGGMLHAAGQQMDQTEPDLAQQANDVGTNAFNRQRPLPKMPQLIALPPMGSGSED